MNSKYYFSDALNPVKSEQSSTRQESLEDGAARSPSPLELAELAALIFARKVSSGKERDAN
jgi:hypothetical protein